MVNINDFIYPLFVRMERGLRSEVPLQCPDVFPRMKLIR